MKRAISEEGLRNALFAYTMTGKLLPTIFAEYTEPCLVCSEIEKILDGLRKARPIYNEDCCDYSYADGIEDAREALKKEIGK